MTGMRIPAAVDATDLRNRRRLARLEASGTEPRTSLVQQIVVLAYEVLSHPELDERTGPIVANRSGWIRRPVGRSDGGRHRLRESG
jgi:hypothetical protein